MTVIKQLKGVTFQKSDAPEAAALGIPYLERSKTHPLLGLMGPIQGGDSKNEETADSNRDSESQEPIRIMIVFGH